MNRCIKLISFMIIITFLFGFISVPGSFAFSSKSKIETTYYDGIKNSSSKVVLIIKLSQESVISYSKKNQIYLYNKIDINSLNSNNYLILDEEYSRNIDSYQDRIIDKMKSLTSIDILDKYKNVINGIAVEIRGYNIRHILNIPEIIQIYSTDEMLYPLRDIMVSTIGATETWNKTTSDGIKVTGTGTTIGIIDSGIDYNHPDFVPGGLGIDKKVISGHDWADNDDDPIDDTPVGHGTHVAGISSGNNETNQRNRGVAPDSKLYAYKVFKATVTGAPMINIIGALEQASKDKCTVVNLSLGSSNPSPSIDENNPYYVALKNLSEAGTVVVAAAGNDGSRHNKNPWPIHAPGVYEPAIQVAATDDRGNDFFKVVLPDGNYLPVNGPLSRYTPPFKAEHSGLEVVNCAYGRVEDFEEVDVKGKIALISRGPREAGIKFQEKNLNAKAAGAVGCIVYNYDPVAIGAIMYDAATEDPYSFGFIPNITIDGLTIKLIKRYLERGAKLVFSEKPNIMISSYTSAGPCLDGDKDIFKPEISAPGSLINSSLPGNKYADYFGTSMATPAVSGSVALLKQMHPEWNPRDIKAIVMNTSDVLINDLSGEVFSYFYQGAGQINIPKAIETPIIASPPSLMKSVTKFNDSFAFEIKNVTDKPVSVSISGETFNIAKNQEPIKIELSKTTLTIQPKSIERINAKFTQNENAFSNRKYEGAIWIKITNKDALKIKTEKLHIPFIVYKNKITDIDETLTNTYISNNSISINNDNQIEIGFTINSGSLQKIVNSPEASESYINYASDLKIYAEDIYGNNWGDIFYSRNLPIGTYKYIWDGMDLDGNEFLPNNNYNIKIEVSGYIFDATSTAQNPIAPEYVATAAKNLPISITNSTLKDPPDIIFGVQNKVKTEEEFCFNITFLDRKDVKSVEMTINFSRNRMTALSITPGEFADPETFKYDLGKGTLTLKAEMKDLFDGKRGRVATIKMRATRKGDPALEIVSYKLIDDKGRDIKTFLVLPEFDIISDDYILGDFNQDDLVNNEDMSLLFSAFGKNNEDPEWNNIYDLNNDMSVGIDDIIIFSKFFEE